MLVGLGLLLTWLRLPLRRWSLLLSRLGPWPLRRVGSLLLLPPGLRLAGLGLLLSRLSLPLRREGSLLLPGLRLAGLRPLLRWLGLPLRRIGPLLPRGLGLLLRRIRRALSAG